VSRPWRRVAPLLIAFVTLAALLALVLGLTLRAGRVPWPLLAPRLPHGTVVLLQGTPYYWVADEVGQLHWASDTRALVGRYVRWDDVRQVTRPELDRLPRGEPWLPSPIGFVRSDDQLYLVRWESGLRWPALLRVPSLEALRIFGITPEMVASRATDRETWERLIGSSVDALAFELPPVDGDSPLAWPSGMWEGSGLQLYPTATYPLAITFTRPAIDPALGVVVGSVDYPSLHCAGRLGLIAAGAEEVHLAERLTSGLEHCTDQGRVTLSRRSAQRLFYLWSLPDDPLTVTGHLLPAEIGAGRSP
jgi:hypothetical protein